MYKEILFTKEAHALHHPDAMMRLLHPGTSKLASVESPLHPLVQEYICSIEPDDNSTWVLVNALGAGEWYGQNINGDFFPYKELVTHTDEWLGLPVWDRQRRHTGSRQIVTGYPSFYDAGVYKHHVNKDIAKSFGDIMAAIWNEKMKRVELIIRKRVELIIRLDHERAKTWLASEIIQRILDGDFPDVSMGCKVPYDVCSICGNKAKTKEQYCIHINERRTNRDPRGDGQRPYMINIKPRFFDLSFVFIGADKTARVLKKIASAEMEKDARSIGVGKMLSKAVPDDYKPYIRKAIKKTFIKDEMKKSAVDETAIRALLYKVASMNKEGRQLKLADIIKYVVPNKDAARVSKIMGGEPDLPEEAQDELARKGIDGAAEETARGGMVLKPHEFMRIALVGSGLKDLADKLRGKTFSPSDDVELPMHPCPVHGSSGGPHEGLKRLFMDRSVTPPAIVKREVRIIMMSPKSQPGNKQEAKSPLLDKISAAYNGYRLWLLANQSELGLNKEASAPSLEAGFGGRVIEEVTGDPELTEAYLLAAHWQAGGR
jgi:hypothetical protein